MNVKNLHTALDYIALCGNTLSSETCIVLQNSLTILQNENHFEQVFFWGKILGLDSDYYIAFGYERDALKGRVFYYSTNFTDWGILPGAKKQAKKLALLSSTRFQGDAALQLDVDTDYTIPVQTNEEEINEQDDTETPELKQSPSQMLKEEDRLAAIITLINDEATVVPRGALFKRPDGYVVENLAFNGLTLAEAQSLRNYHHYRIPQQRWNTNLLTQTDYNLAIDFLDTIDIDVPKERCWSMHIKLGGKVAILQSLYWPGMTFYHCIRSREHGFMYVGNGRKNMDLPFMIY